MKNKRLNTRKFRYVFLILLTCVLCVGCNNIGIKTKKQIMLDSLEIEFWRQDSLHKVCINKYNHHVPMDTFWHYRTKCVKCTDEMLKIHREIVRVWDGNAR